jgi:hypothetical protein
MRKGVKRDSDRDNFRVDHVNENNSLLSKIREQSYMDYITKLDTMLSEVAREKIFPTSARKENVRRLHSIPEN